MKIKTEKTIGGLSTIFTIGKNYYVHFENFNGGVFTINGKKEKVENNPSIRKIIKKLSKKGE